LKRKNDMAKVRTLSQKFMKGHPNEGEPTLFVEKVLNSLGIDYFDGEYLAMLHNLNKGKEDVIDITGFFFSLGMFQDTGEEKLHTIRSGHHFKKGDMIQLAVWSGKPYASPQIKICPPLEVVQVYDFNIINDIDDLTWIDIRNKYYHRLDMDINQSVLPMVAQNDGLSTQEFLDWFQVGKKEFKGQVICWKDPEY
jgi:hypothetical protein